MANITGWGRGTWGQGAWNAPIPVVVSGIEQVTNGDFDSDTTGWSTTSNSSASVSGGIVTITANQYHTFSQNLTLDAGRSYTISVLATAKSGNFYVAIHDGSSVTDFTNVTVGTTTLTFTANSGTNQLRLYPYSSGTGHTLSVDSISVKGAVETEGTASVGTATVLPSITVAVTGVAGTTAVGSESVAASSNTTIDFRDSLMATSFSQEFGLTVDGFVNDGQTISNGSDTEDITNTERTQDIVLAAEMDLPSSFTKASCIWETGGTGNGAWFGISEQSGAYFLRFRAGDGTEGNNTTSNSISIAQVAVSTLPQFFDGNTHTVVWAIDRDIGKTEIYIDGQLVADGQTSDGSNVTWAGGANGAFGVASGTPAGGDSDDGSTQFQSEDAFTGTIRSDLRMYKNEFIATQTNSTVTGGATVVETGLAGTGAVGNTVETGTSVVGATGNQGSGQIGDEVTRPQGIFGVTGVQGTTALNSVAAAPQSIISVTGVAGTGQAGTTTAPGTALVAPTGVEGTGQLGNEVAFSNVTVVETGLAGTTGLGSVTALPSITIAVTGLAGTTGLGNETVLPSITTAVTGQVGTTSLGTATALPSIEFAATGFAATGSVGDVLAAGGAKVVEDAVTGSVNLGDEAVKGDANLSVTGVSSTGGIGNTDTGTITFTITVASKSSYDSGSSNAYYINGVERPVLTLVEGKTYRFDQSDSSNGAGGGHPFRFSTTPNGSHASGSEYTTGVTTNGTPGSAGAYTEITVASDAPTLYYYCTNHSNMGNTAFTSDSIFNVTGGSTITPSAATSTSAVGTATVLPSIEVDVTTVVGTMSIGNESVLAINNVSITGVEATGTLGTLNLYGLIENNVSVSYTEVTPSQNANYEAA